MQDEKVKILIAEDEKIIALDIKKTLQRLGYNVLGMVNNGPQALNFLQTTRPDLILMDIMLKGELSGIETASIINQEYGVPFVYLTALTDDETLNKAKITEPFGYVVKPFNERGLHSAIEMALYKHRAENELKKKTEELEAERVKTDKLLHNIFPAEIVKELKEKGTATPRSFNNITILFTEFCDFTKMVSEIPHNILLPQLDEIFQQFDNIIEKYELEKLKTIGDIYMVAGGIPKETGDHAARVICAALEMLDYVEDYNLTSDIKFKMRSGVNSGQVVAGIVGANKYTYDIWGDAVNIASRMGNSCDAGKVNISGATYQLVRDHFNFLYRGKLEAKGKGEIEMYYVTEPRPVITHNIKYIDVT
jgi:class 3 adenylate cyclase/CheY-like chemotaxis protein